MRGAPLVLALVVLPANALAQEAPDDAPLPEPKRAPAPTWGTTPAPSVYPTYASWTPPPATPLPPKKRWLFFVLEGGGAYESLYGFSAITGGGSAGIDMELRPLVLTIVGTFAYGPLNLGVANASFDVLHGGVEATCLGRIGILRIGAGLGFGVLRLPSVTRDASPTAVTFDPSILASIDFLTFGEDKSAAYLGAKLRGSIVMASDATPVLWGPEAVLGFRL
jgi:hypothetical protein